VMTTILGIFTKSKQDTLAELGDKELNSVPAAPMI
jgi:hypothetical protein